MTATRFLSTAGEAPEVTLAEAVRRGLAPDGGLYFPTEWRPLAPSFFAGLAGMELAESAYQVARPLLGSALAPAALRDPAAAPLALPIPPVRPTAR